MAKKILWLDDDKTLVESYSLYLGTKGFTTTRVITATEALKEIQSNKYTVFILDVMLPLCDEDERLLEEDTDFGQELGLVFYKRYKDLLETKNIPVFVLTIRESGQIETGFLTLGLPKNAYMKKSECANPAALHQRLAAILKDGKEQA